MAFLKSGQAWLHYFDLSGQTGFFGSNWRRRLFFLDFAVFPAAILICLALAADGGTGPVLPVLLFGAGYAAWTLTEYLMHRFVFHHVPFFSAMHLAHHKAPHDLIGTPTLVTLAAFGLLVFWPLQALAGAGHAAAAAAGMMSGYLAYAGIHYLVHNSGSFGWPWMKRLIRLHAVHHHDTGCNFGVTTAFWDRIFGTKACRKPGRT